MSSIAKIQHKGQVTIPTSLRTEAGLAKGDLVEFSFERGKIVITPKLVVDRSSFPSAEGDYTSAQRRAIDRYKWTGRARTQTVESPRNQFFAGTALSGDQYAARLRRNCLYQLKDRTHFRTLPNNVVEAREPPQLPAQITSFLFPLEVFKDLAHCPAQLIHQLVILDNVTIRTGIDRGNRRLHSGHSGD